jgi:hypothetical protein
MRRPLFQFPMVCFYRVRRILILLLFIMTLSAIFLLLVGCGSGSSQGQGGQQDHATDHQSANVMLNMHPEGNSGVSGTASFEDTSDRVIVKLDLRNLPKPETLYLAHIHPGTCAEGESHEHGGAHGEEGYGHEHGGSTHEHGGGTHEHGAAEIEYPLSQVKSDSEGRGSSTTTLHETSVDKLFSGEPKHVNVHEAGSGNPPILTCAELTKQKGGGEKQHGSHGQQAQHEQHPIEKACREEPKHLRVFNCGPMGMEGVVYDVQMQPERDRQTYEQALVHIDHVVPDELAIHVYFYSGERDYRERHQNAVATVTVAGDYSVGQYGKTAPPLDGKLE